MFIENFANKLKIPYFDTTGTFAVCKSDGVRYGGLWDRCPTCNSDTYQFSRVVGFYVDMNKSNAGRKSEFNDRRYLSKDLNITYD